MELANTRRALDEIENLLCCGVCRQLVNNPCNLGSCEHFFCRSCAENYIGKCCPECSVPSHVKDVSTNRQLESAVTLCQKLSWLLLKSAANKTVGSKEQDDKALPVGELKSAGREKVDENAEKCLNSKSCDVTDVQILVQESTGSSGRVMRKRTVSKDAQNKATNMKTVAAKTKSKRIKTNKSGSSGEADVQTVTPKRRLPAVNSVSTVEKQSKGRSINSPKPHLVTSPCPAVRRSIPLGSNLGSPGASLSGTPSRVKKNVKGETPLHVAVIKGDYDHVRVLLEENTIVNTKDHAGWTPLHEACNHGYIAIVELLLDHGAFINVPGGDNDTPLHDAVQNERCEIVRLLLSRGADANAKNLRGYKPADLAKTREMRDALKTQPAESQLDTSITTVPSSLAVQEVVLLSTGLDRKARARVQQCASVLHGKIVTEYSPKVTHLVTPVNPKGQCPRTLKFLNAVLGGKWIINMDWVDVCLEYGTRVSEEAFEVPGCSSSPDSMAPTRARLNNEHQLPGLFDGCNFFLQGPFSYPTPCKEELAEIITAGGGKLLRREPRPDSRVDDTALTVPYHAGDGSRLAACSHFTLTDQRGVDIQLVTARLCVSPAAWLMDCVANFRLVDHTTGVKPS